MHEAYTLLTSAELPAFTQTFSNTIQEKTLFTGQCQLNGENKKKNQNLNLNGKQRIKIKSNCNFCKELNN